MAQGIDPIHQFQLHDLAGPWNIAGHEISFTNSALFMGIAVGLITVILLAAAARGALVPGRLQSVGEMWYEFVQRPMSAAKVTNMKSVYRDKTKATGNTFQDII